MTIAEKTIRMSKKDGYVSHAVSIAVYIALKEVKMKTFTTTLTGKNNKFFIIILYNLIYIVAVKYSIFSVGPVTNVKEANIQDWTRDGCVSYVILIAVKNAMTRFDICLKKITLKV